MTRQAPINCYLLHVYFRLPTAQFVQKLAVRVRVHCLSCASATSAKDIGNFLCGRELHPSVTVSQRLQRGAMSAVRYGQPRHSEMEYGRRRHCTAWRKCWTHEIAREMTKKKDGVD